MADVSTSEKPQAFPDDYVGFDTVPKQREKKFLRRGFNLNLMVVGESGLGKSTFINTLFSSHLVESKAPKKRLDINGKTTEIHSLTYDVVEGDVTMTLTLIDTPGFADQINNEYCWDPILRYIKDQYAQHLRKELSPTREKRIPDTRVHGVLYFIAPTGHSLKALDVIVLKKLSEIVNIIPVIAKSDSLTLEERAGFKARIKDEFKIHGISVFPLPEPCIDNFLDPEDLEMNDSIRKLVPFTVIGSEQTMSVNGKVAHVRQHRWGIINVEDPVHCEFVHLRNFLIRTHLDTLIESTALIHYENFRTKQLLALKEASKGQG